MEINHKDLEYIRSLELTYEEQISLMRSNGFYNYWECYRAFKQQKLLDTIEDILPLIVGVAVNSIMLSTVQDIINKNKGNRSI